jgi:predicted glycosyltransferase
MALLHDPIAPHIYDTASETRKMKIMVYSHDAFGLGNIRRMLAICEHLLRSIPALSILVVSGSPALHSLRLPPGLDYIKLPCIGRDQAGELSVRYLHTDMNSMVKLRSDLILTATENFQPDLLLVDKKPDGIEGELKATLSYLKSSLPRTKLVLLLRDILDRPSSTIAQWNRHRYYELIDRLYDQVWVVGTAEIFDVSQEYCFPLSVQEKVKFCGYIYREAGLKSRSALRYELQVRPHEFLVLVTPGGGGDGYHLVETYLTGLGNRPFDPSTKSLIIFGSEMSESERSQLTAQASAYPQVQLLEFTDDMLSYMAAADVVVAMGGYNTVGEILSTRKRAIVVPRIKPAEEQLIRAERMTALNLFKMIHPHELDSSQLIAAVQTEIDRLHIPFMPRLDMGGLSRIASYTLSLLPPTIPNVVALNPHSLKPSCLIPTAL